MLPGPDNSETYDYEKYPFYDSFSIRDQALEGTVVSTGMAETVIVRREYDVFVLEYGRYMKRRSHIPTHIPGMLDDIAVDGEITIAETRPSSKAKSRVIVEIMGDSE